MQSPAWQALTRHRAAMAATPLAELVLGDPQRQTRYELALGGLRLNYALQCVNDETLTLLCALARQQGLADWRDRMYRGEKINVTEDRAVLHVALRQQSSTPIMLDGRDIMHDVHATRARMAGFASAVRDGEWPGATGQRITDIVHIGIGGSDLGPRLVLKALASQADGPSVHFVANADAAELLATLKPLNPATTLFVVVSKTFTTQETLLNARTARSWLVAALGEAAVVRHFVAVSVNLAAVQAFGIAAENIFPMADWAGGRFSLWSAVGLSIELAIGTRHFDALLAGAAAMDTHFATAPLERNLPVILGLLGIWNTDFLGCPALAILPYSERLRELPRFLQQLEMESNGKSVTRDGQPVGIATVPVIFGDCGTISQHSFHQWLHQGTQRLPADFIGVATDDLAQPEHHAALLANLAAQAGAFAFGQREAAHPADVYPGNRPSAVIMLDRLDPYQLGQLLALYEHKVFVQGIIWGLNSFDQPGVELGKRMAKKLDQPLPADEPAGVFLAEFLAHLRQPAGRSA